MGQRRIISGSRILITGASQGIGKALAQTAAARGARVLVCARKLELLQDLAQHIRAQGGIVEFVQADVTSQADRQKLVEAAEKAFGGLDILVNNAGIGATGHFADVGPERLRQIMEVNFFGTTETIRAFLPMLKKGHKPAIVNISSIAAKRGIPARSEYSASKFAVQGFSEAIRAELAKDGVDVIVVCPGLTQTNFSHNMIEQKALVQLDHMRGMSAEDVARHTLRAIEKGYNESCLTLKGKLMVIVSRFFPWIADIVVKHKVRGLFQDEIAARKQTAAKMSPALPGVKPMAGPHKSTSSLLVIACFSRHLDALRDAGVQLTQTYGPVALTSPDFDFHHTKYYDATMGAGLIKRFLVFDSLAAPDCLPEVKRATIALENEIAASGRYPEIRPINLDPGLVQLGKFLLASTKDQGHRIYLRDGIFAEVTLRYQGGTFDVWPWTYADYREPAVREFLVQARTHLYEKLRR